MFAASLGWQRAVTLIFALHEAEVDFLTLSQGFVIPPGSTAQLFLSLISSFLIVPWQVDFDFSLVASMPSCSRDMGPDHDSLGAV